MQEIVRWTVDPTQELIWKQIIFSHIAEKMCAYGEEAVSVIHNITWRLKHLHLHFKGVESPLKNIENILSKKNRPLKMMLVEFLNKYKEAKWNI